MPTWNRIEETTDWPSLSPERVRTLSFCASLDAREKAVVLVKKGNHVFRIQADDKVYYLKSHTKNWYPKDPALVSQLPLREAVAWRTLAASGLSVPRVVQIDASSSNEIGRPFIITEGLQGESLTILIDKHVQSVAHQLIRAVGSYLKVMHSIEFEKPGFLSPGGPEMPGQWRHRTWGLQGFEAWIEQEQQEARLELAPGTFAALCNYVARWKPVLRGVFEHPRFVHGDCHAHQFYLFPENHNWRVSGVVDMEVASAGDPGEDFMKFCAELARRYEAGTEWWNPLFEGYGQAPDFDLLKLRYLASGQIELSPFAYQNVPGVREDVVRHLLDARSWRDLFDLSTIRKKHKTSAL